MNTILKIFKEWFPIVCGIYYLAGISGFIYETIFYIINNGALTRRGCCFGPWIPIYGYGSVIMFILLFYFRKNPFLVFILSAATSGILEFATGYYMYHCCDGLRTWDYNTEIWNWGNIGGYVCFRSVMVFALGGLALFYGLVPFLTFLQTKMNSKLFWCLMVIPAVLFLADSVYNMLLVTIFPLTCAKDFYKSTGWYPIVGQKP